MMRISGSKRRWVVSLLAFVGLGLTGVWYAGMSTDAARKAAERECRTLRDSKQWKQLAVVARRWSEWDSKRADPWLFRAEASEQARNALETADYLSHVPDSDPRAAAALGALAAIQFEALNRPRDGILTCERILQIDPRVTSVHKKLIFFALSTLQRPEMIRRIREAIRLRRESPESYVFLAGAHWLYPSTLYTLNSHWLESDPDSELFQVARAMQVYDSNAKENLERAGDFRHIPTAAELLKKFPHNPELLAYHLEFKMADGDADAVQKLLDAAPSSTEDDARFWRARAWIQDARGEPSLAEESLKRALTIDPYWWKLHFQIMDLYRRLQQPDEVARFSEIYKNSKRLSNLIYTLQDGDAAPPEFYERLLFVADALDDSLIANAVRFRNLAN